MEKKWLDSKQIFLFDAFGTLFKTSEISNELDEIAGEKTEALIVTWRTKQLQYSWLRNQMNQYVPFSQVTKDALDFSMRKHGLKNPRIMDLLLPIYDHPSLVDGALEGLQFLHQKNKKVGILSNGTPSMLENGVHQTGIQNMVSVLFSVDDIGIYKPRKEVYQMALDRLEAIAEEVLFFSSNQWDVSGASCFGLDCVWVNQYDEVRESLPFGNVKEIRNLGALSQLE